MSAHGLKLKISKAKAFDIGEIIDYLQNNFSFKFFYRKGSEKIRNYLYENGKYEYVSDYEFEAFIKEKVEELTGAPFNKNKKLHEILELLKKTRKNINKDINQLNADESVINFKNGLLDLKTMELREHTPDVLSTIQLNAKYEGATPTPVFDSFLDDLTEKDKEKKQALLEYMGACFSNINGYRLKKALILKGKGNTGKSVLRSVVDCILGDENTSSGSLASLESRFGKFDLFEKRLFGSSDLGYMNVSQLETFKSVTGGDNIQIEEKCKNSFSYRYKGLMWFGTNALPHFGGDRGDWVYERMLIIECNNVISKENRDSKLVEKIIKEAPGIIYKALVGLKEAIERGYEFFEPDKSKNIKEEYKVENSPYVQFANECLEKKENDGRYTTGRVQVSLKNWCSENFPSFKPNVTDFKRELKEHGYDMEIKKTNGNTFYKKITLNVKGKVYYIGTHTNEEKYEEDEQESKILLSDFD